MANPQGFDKLNILKKHSIPYPEYFADMELTPKQKKEREKFCYILEDLIIIYFEMIKTSRDMGILNEYTIKQELMYNLYEAVDDKGFFENVEELDRYVEDFVDVSYATTISNLDEHPNDMDYTGEQQYWISEDRAKFIAEDQSNTLFNSKDYVEALKANKKQKIWKSFGDERVRHTHEEVDVTMIDIDDYFEVGAAKMLYPKDVTSALSTGAEHPEEVINCRCQFIYV
jgi:bisphosphoglycerate-dependent phosphoglycerate mutase